MRERPILFSAAMILAILAGRKTQTRRVIDPRMYIEIDDGDEDHIEQSDPRFREAAVEFGMRRYGHPGERLWVRETWAPCEAPILRGRFQYAADGAVGHRIDIGGELVWARSGYTTGVTRGDPTGIWVSKPSRWRPSIHMPRRASRIDLDVIGVRVERLQEISEEDAIAEGVTCWICGARVDGLSENDCACFHTNTEAVPSFRDLWDSINGERGHSWASNPWVWVVEFRRAA